MTALIGTNPDQIPINAMLGGMAYQDPSNISVSGLLISSGSDTDPKVVSYSSTGAAIFTLQSGDGTTSSKYNYIRFISSQSSSKEWRVGNYGSDSFTIRDHTTGLDRIVVNGNGDTSFLSTGAIKVSTGTTAQRPASPTEGMIRKNNDYGRTEMFLRGSWQTLEEEYTNKNQRNLIDNGSFIITQRTMGPSATGPTSAFGCDRWKTVVGTSGSNFMSISSFLSTASYGNTLQTTFNNSISPSISDVNSLYQVLNVPGISNGTMQLSFGVESSLSGNLSFGIYNYATDRVFVSTVSLVANTYKKVVLQVSSIPGINSLEGTSVLFFNLGSGANKLTSSLNNWFTAGGATNWWGATGSINFVSNSGTLNISEVQLEVSDTPTKFERRSYANELLTCKQYFQIAGFEGVTKAGISKAPDATCSYMSFGTVQFPIDMKTSIYTIELYNPTTGATGQARNFNAGTDHPVAVSRYTSSGFTAYINNSSIAAGNEVGFNYIAKLDQ